MEKIDINIDWCDNNFAACLENEDVVCVATGKTLAEVQEKNIEAIDFQIEGLLVNGDVVIFERSVRFDEATRSLNF